MNETAAPLDGDHEELCRVCRGGHESGPLMRPCRCKGSIEFCHEDCLSSWLAVSRGSRCELCKHPFRWEKIYSAETPSRLPLTTIIRHLLLGGWTILLFALRGVLVCVAWLGVLPYTVLSVIRGLLWFSSHTTRSLNSLVELTPWSRLSFAQAVYHVLFSPSSPNSDNGPLTAVHSAAQSDAARNFSAAPQLDSLEKAVAHVLSAFATSSSSGNSPTLPLASSSSRDQDGFPLLRLFFDIRTGHRSFADVWNAQKDQIEALARDCFSGQIIVCCSVVIFIAIFLLREWVVANQHPPPLAIDVAVPPIHAPAEDTAPRVVLAAEDNLGTPANTADSVGASPIDTTSARDRQTEITEMREWSSQRAGRVPTPPVAEQPTALHWEEYGVPSTSNSVESDHNEHARASTPSLIDQNAAPSLPIPVEPAAVAQRAPPAVIVAPARQPVAADWASDDDADSDDDDIARLPNANPANAGVAGGNNVLDNEDDLFFEADIDTMLQAVGMRGSLIILLQNVALMTLLICVSVIVAVWTPLLTAKTILIFRLFKLVFVPINIVRLVTDPIADTLVRYASAVAPLALPQSSAHAKSSGPGFVTRFLLNPATKVNETSASAIGIFGFTAHYRSTATSTMITVLDAVRHRWHTMTTEETDVDRVFCVALGYTVFFTGAALYLRFTRNAQAQHISDALREIVKQQFLMLKAATFFFIEILLFPTLCGILLNVATIPIFPGVSIYSRVAYHIRHPIAATFLTWLAGTNFMYAFASMIGVIRKCVRSGVLWFIRDPTDPDSNPLREILETPAFSQAKKISRSLVMYGAILLTLFGIFPWLSLLCSFTPFPLRWQYTRSQAKVPLEQLSILFILPYTFGKTRPRRALRKLLSEWLTLTAHQLRLSSFLLGERKSDEEGYVIRSGWRARLRIDKLGNAVCATKTPSSPTSSAQCEFQRDGSFARVVAADNVKLVAKAMFVPVSESGEPLDQAGKEIIEKQLSLGPNDDSKFTVVYIPPNFRSRITLFVYLLWITGSIAIFTCVSVPLLVGRFILDRISTEPSHDLLAIAIGAHVLLYSYRCYRSIIRAKHHPLNHIQPVLLRKWLATAGYLLCLALLAGGMLPLLCGMVVQVYIFNTLGSASSTTVSLSTSWSFGLLYCSLALSITRMLGSNRLPARFAETAYTGWTSENTELLRTVIFTNVRCLVALSLPGVFAWTQLLTRQLLWLSIKPDTPYPVGPDTDAFRATLYSVMFASTLVFALSPMKRLAARWSKHVWDREFVLRRKLKNIDDPVNPNDEEVSVHP